MNEIKAIVKNEGNTFIVYAVCEGYDNEELKRYTAINAKQKAVAYADGYNRARQTSF